MEKSGDKNSNLEGESSKNLKFGNNGFLDLISDISNNGFIITQEFLVGQKNLLLRHDVDYDLNCAFELATKENEMDIPAHFFFLSSSPYYQLGSRKVRRKIRRIAELGHSIGLHYDASKENKESFEIQKRTLEDSMEQTIDIFSQHNPTLNGFKRNVSPELAIDVMELNSKFKPTYISDSNMLPRKNFHLTFQQENSVHLLLHPEYWALDISDFQEFERLMMSRLPKNQKNLFSQHLNLMKLTLRDRESLDFKNRL